MPGSCRGLPAVLNLPLRTERLVLRPFTPEDEDSLYVFHSDPDAVRYVPYAPRTREQVAEVLLRKMSNIALRQEGDLLELAVTLADDQTVIGDLLLALQSVAHQTLEIGYIFAPAAGGRGYATEAVRRAGRPGVRPDRSPADHRPRRRPQPFVLGAAGAARVPARGPSGRERVVQGRAVERAGLRPAVPGVAGHGCWLQRVDHGSVRVVMTRCPKARGLQASAVDVPLRRGGLLSRSVTRRRGTPARSGCPRS